MSSSAKPNKKLSEILEAVTRSSEDVHSFGAIAVRTVEKSEALHDPSNNFGYLRNFLSDQIDFLCKEIKHTRKYSPAIYDPNVPLSREWEREAYMQILASLESQKK